jgi:hypothetical protein
VSRISMTLRCVGIFHLLQKDMPNFGAESKKCQKVEFTFVAAYISYVDVRISLLKNSRLAD